jgi:hypothetical protein
MDKLDHYLEQVCRSIGGPRSLRRHVRQELREHLLDAAAEHKAAGMSEEQALACALEDFGGPEQVRSELEATHGQRLIPVVIDKAMQWKEMTMRAKWLWMSWAHLALAAVIALEVLWITFSVIFLVPRFERLLRDGLIDPEMLQETGSAWMVSFLKDLKTVGGGYATFWLLGAAVAWGVFEWRVKSENKSFMRLSALGTAAVGLMVVAVLTAGSLVITYQLGAPATGRLARSFALDQIATIDTSLSALEQALAKRDWEAMRGDADRVSHALDNLTKAAPVIPALASWNAPPAAELRGQVKAASECLLEARQSLREKDVERLKAAIQRFHELFGPVAKAAREPGAA